LVLIKFIDIDMRWGLVVGMSIMENLYETKTMNYDLTKFIFSKNQKN
jgi:hypothetical protein